MADPRIAIVRAWLGEDNPWENVDRLLARCEAENEIRTEDAAEALNELDDEDFAVVVGTLIKRRHQNFNDRVDLARLVLAGADIAPDELAAPTEHPSELVERVARTMFDEHSSDVKVGISWEQASPSIRRSYWNLAQSALSALPPPMSSVDREIVEAAEAWSDYNPRAPGADATRVLFEAVERKRAQSREGGKP